ncbi:type II toxin-antitoxin system VapB family antitoxin [soil metagenome]
MALNIKSLETERLVRELAKRTGLTITEAVHQAAADKLRAMETDREARLARMTPAQREKLRKIEGICKEASALPALENRTADEIIGYDEKGMW